MKSFAYRRIINFSLLLISAVSLYVYVWALESTLQNPARFSGWTLLGMVLFLAAYNVRKKLPFLPLGSSAMWLQIHIYIGLLTGFVFGIHLGWQLPNGLFECLLAAAFAAVFLSGVAGLALTRSFAKRLATRKDEIIFERIPWRRKQIRREAEQLVFEQLSRQGALAIPQFYVEHLHVFFSAPQNFWGHLFQTTHARHTLLSELKTHERYLSEPDREVLRSIAGCVERKDDLDYQFALQSTLKHWLFVHIPLTYVLLVFSFFHLFLVNAFSGAAV
jgi:hypothetical protein